MWNEITIIALGLTLAWAMRAEWRAYAWRREVRYMGEKLHSVAKARDMFRESLDMLAEDYSALQAEHREKRLRERNRRSAAGAKGHETRRKRAEVGAEVRHGS
jgi:hypothetical protein